MAVLWDKAALTFFKSGADMRNPINTGFQGIWKPVFFYQIVNFAPLSNSLSNTLIFV